jgi:hypothetical protein
MAQREFANQTALVAYAEQNDLAYEYEYTPAFAKWQRLLSPEQYEIVEARTSRGVIMQAELEANAPLREEMAIAGPEGEAGGQTAFNVRGGRARIVLKIATRAATRYHWASGKLWHLWGGPNIACGG